MIAEHRGIGLPLTKTLVELPRTGTFNNIEGPQVLVNMGEQLVLSRQ